MIISNMQILFLILKQSDKEMMVINVGCGQYFMDEYIVMEWPVAPSMFIFRNNKIYELDFIMKVFL